MNSLITSTTESDFEKYFGGILDGKIVACEKMKRISDMLIEKYLSPKEFHFDMEIAKNHIDFIQKFCKIPSGSVGEKLDLELFQRARLQAIFGFVDDTDMREYNECIIIEGRKNGKTTECAAVEIDMLVNDHEGSPQIYNVATALDQAKLGFNAANKMRMQSPMLSKHLKKRASDIYFPLNYGTIKALASNVNSLDGLDTHCGVIDELSAIKNRDTYDLVKQSMGARSQPLLFTITTNGYIRNGIFDTQYQYAKNILEGKAVNERFLPFIYELDDASEWDKPECWIKANPGLGTIKKTEFLQQMVQKAKDDPSFKPTVMIKDFNIPQTSESAWLRYEDAHNEEKWDISFRYGIGGFDAADTIDLNAATALFMRPGDDKIYRRSMYWIPQSVLDEMDKRGTRQERDNMPYRLWIDQGYMRTCPGYKCDKKIFLEWFKELRKEGMNIMFIGYDPWHIDDSLLREFVANFGKNAMIPIRQGSYTLSEPMKNLAADLKAKRVVSNGNPVDEACLLNTAVKTDINGNIQPIKDVSQYNRIDGTIALICGYKVLQDKMDQYINLNKGVIDNEPAN